MVTKTLVGVFSILSLFFLSSCSDNKGPASGTSDTTEDLSCFYEPIAGLRLSIAVHFQGDRIYVKDNVEKRRGVMLEYLDVDAIKAAQAAETALIEIGFSAKSEKEVDDNGVSRQIFARADGVPNEIFLAVFPDPGKKPSHPDAKGRIWFSWKQ